MQLNKTTSHVLSALLEKQFWKITEQIKPEALTGGYCEQAHTTSAASLWFSPVSITRLPSLSAQVKQSEPTAGRSHFFNVPGTMGCFFLDHCCILAALLPFGPLSYTIHRDRKL